MTRATLTSKGQVTIPQDIRIALGLQPGDKLDFVLVDGTLKVIQVHQPRVDDLRGVLARAASAPGQPAGDAHDLETALAQAFAEDWQRQLAQGQPGGKRGKRQ